MCIMGEEVLKPFINYNVTEILIFSRKLYRNRLIVLELALVKYSPTKNMFASLPIFLLNNLSDRYISNVHHPYKNPIYGVIKLYLFIR